MDKRKSRDGTHSGAWTLPETFVPIDHLSPICGSNPPPGALVYLPYGKSYSLWGPVIDESQLMLDLGGEKPLIVWPIKEDGLGSSVKVDNWRIEVDPGSACDTKNRQPPWGHAFIGPKVAGIVGRYAIGRQELISMQTDGELYRAANSGPSGAFSVWRITVGTGADLNVLVKSSSFSISNVE
jgi:hypothetical protein